MKLSATLPKQLEVIKLIWVLLNPVIIQLSDLHWTVTDTDYLIASFSGVMLFLGNIWLFYTNVGKSVYLLFSHRAFFFFFCLNDTTLLSFKPFQFLKSHSVKYLHWVRYSTFWGFKMIKVSMTLNASQFHGWSGYDSHLWRMKKQSGGCKGLSRNKSTVPRPMRNTKWMCVNTQEEGRVLRKFILQEGWHFWT